MGQLASMQAVVYAGRFLQRLIKQSHVGDSLPVEENGISLEIVVGPGMLSDLFKRQLYGLEIHIVVPDDQAIGITASCHTDTLLTSWSLVI